MRQTKAIVLSAAALLGLLALARFPPDRYPVYPLCPFHAATGLLCPGCGATRALAALLRGRLAEAWHLNALFLALLPPAFVYGLTVFRRWYRGERNPWPRIPAAALSVLAAAALLFSVWRNLAPH